ncbi:hypothetical protein ACLK10_00660 [Escherichia coli]
MQGGYNIHPGRSTRWMMLTGTDRCAKHFDTLLMFDNFMMKRKRKQATNMRKAGYAVLGGCRMVPELPGAG